MPVVVRKNGALNNAAAGLAAGIPQGFAMGQQARRTQDYEKQQGFENDQVLRRAQQVDQELQREAGERQAVGEAAGALAGGDAMQAPQQAANDPDSQAIERVRNIAARLPKDQAIRFVGIAREQHQQVVDKRERDSLTDKIANTIADGSLFPIQPDGTKTESPESTKSIQKLAEMAANPKTDVSALKIQLANVKNEAANAEARFRRRQSVGTWVSGLADQVGADQPQTGVQDPAVVSGQLQQKAQLHKLASWWTQFQDDIESHPKGMEKFQEAVLDASNGLTYVNGKKVPFTMAKKEEELQAAKAQTEQFRQQLIQAQTEREKLQPANDAKRADAAMQSATRPRGPASGTVSRPMSQSEAANQARAMLKERGEENPLPSRVAFIARQIQGAFSGEEQAPQGEPTPEATSAANAGAASKLASPALRRADVLANPSKYLRFKTKAEAEAWIEHGD